MTADSSTGEGPRWLLEPPKPGEIRFNLAIGEGQQLTPEVQEALDRLLVALDFEPIGDVQGYAGGLGGCGSNCGNNCGLGGCGTKGFIVRFNPGIFEIQGIVASKEFGSI
jgi:hypothetical protein